jgi:hypothetical protein
MLVTLGKLMQAMEISYSVIPNTAGWWLIHMSKRFTEL